MYFLGEEKDWLCVCIQQHILHFTSSVRKCLHQGQETLPRWMMIICVCHSCLRYRQAEGTRLGNISSMFSIPPIPSCCSGWRITCCKTMADAVGQKFVLQRGMKHQPDMRSPLHLFIHMFLYIAPLFLCRNLFSNIKRQAFPKPAMYGNYAANPVLPGYLRMLQTPPGNPLPAGSLIRATEMGNGIP